MAALLFSWAGEGRWSMGSELIGERTPDDHLQVDGSVSLQYAPLERLQFYGEWYTFQPVNSGAGSRGEHYANSGFIYRLSNDTQVDARFGVGLNHAASKSFFGVGLSFRR